MYPSEPRKKNKKNLLSIIHSWSNRDPYNGLLYIPSTTSFFWFHCFKWLSILWYPSLDTTPVHQFLKPSFVATPRYQHRQWQPVSAASELNLQGLKKTKQQGIRNEAFDVFFFEKWWSREVFENKKNAQLDEVVNSQIVFFANRCHREFHKGFNKHCPSFIQIQLDKNKDILSRTNTKDRPKITGFTINIFDHKTRGAESPPHTLRSLENPRCIK